MRAWGRKPLSAPVGGTRRTRGERVKSRIVGAGGGRRDVPGHPAAISRHVGGEARHACIRDARQRNLRVSQPAMPAWSGCMCVTMTRVSGPLVGPVRQQLHPHRHRLVGVHPRVDDGPPGIVFQRPQVDVVQRIGQRHADPVHALRHPHQAALRGKLGKRILDPRRRCAGRRCSGHRSPFTSCSTSARFCTFSDALRGKVLNISTRSGHV